MPNRTKRSPQASRFTLVELIVVLVVTMIIVGMGVGVASSLSKAGKPEAGVRMLSRMIMLARQHAVSTNQRVALLLPTGDSSYSSTAFQTTYSGIEPHGSEEACIVMGMCTVSGRSSSGFSFKRIIQGTKWEFLPKGVYLSSTMFSSVSNVEVPQNSTTSVSKNMTAIIFKPNGSIEGATHITDLVVKPDSRTSAGRVFYGITINWLTGKTTVSNPTSL